MKSSPHRLLLTLALSLGLAGVAAAAPFIANMQGYANPSGTARTYSTLGDLDQANDFFQSLGTNGRRCSTCHMPSQAFGLGAAMALQIFNNTDGLNPLFRPVDGTNSPLMDTSTVFARRQAYSMLLSKGVFRVGIGIPAGAEFALEAIDDPYGYASAGELSLFRRPLPATNLKFLTIVMWDGRQTFAGQTMAFNLGSQANGATMGHAQARQPLTQEQRDEIVSFETSLFTAQAYDRQAWNLNDAGARGGPQALSAQEFRVRINNPLSSTFTPRVFTIYDAWQTATGTPGPARQAIFRGQQLFNFRQFSFNGQTVTCSRCHNSFNAGSDSNGQFFNIGTTASNRRTPDMPLYTLRNNTTGVRAQTTDPGRALITGRWTDVSRFKIPILRGLAARAPYFHNGMAATLDDVVAFYDTRMGIGLTAQDRADLAAFLRAL
jgi:cytochrome c peroxidase